MDFHPIANIFPLIEGEEFERLKTDVSANGLIESIWLHPDGSILDGRNRWRACEATDTDAHFQTYDGNLSNAALIAFIVSLNKERRHLTSSQLAACVVKAGDLLEQLESEANDRQGQRTDLQQNSQNLVETFPQGKSRDQAAALFGTNGRYVQDARRDCGSGQCYKSPNRTRNRRFVTKWKQFQNVTNFPRRRLQPANL
jgi:hypothetical protein